MLWQLLLRCVQCVAGVLFLAGIVLAVGFAWWVPPELSVLLVFFMPGVILACDRGIKRLRGEAVDPSDGAEDNELDLAFDGSDSHSFWGDEGGGHGGGDGGDSGSSGH